MSFASCETSFSFFGPALLLNLPPRFPMCRCIFPCCACERSLPAKSVLSLLLCVAAVLRFQTFWHPCLDGSTHCRSKLDIFASNAWPTEVFSSLCKCCKVDIGAPSNTTIRPAPSDSPTRATLAGCCKLYIEETGIPCNAIDGTFAHLAGIACSRLPRSG